VQLNVMFAEPLVPGPGGDVPTRSSAPACVRSDQGVDPATALRSAAAVCDDLRDAGAGLVVVGTLPSPEASGQVQWFTEKLGWPVFPDITSGLRLGPGGAPRVPYYDAWLQAGLPVQPPDTVLHLGGPLVSKALARFLAETRPRRYYQVAGPWGRVDPDALVTVQAGVTAEAFAGAAGDLDLENDAGSWGRLLREQQGPAGDLLATAIEDVPGVHEPWVARSLAQRLPGNHALLLGNSMPVRNMNTFAGTSGPACRVAANRGASGIDGNVATAAGFAAGARAPVTLLLGDLALLHDLNALHLVAQAEFPVVVVVVNNDGGGIFHFLPIAAHADVFEPYFGAPHGLGFAAAARQFGLPYFRPDSRAAFLTAYEEAAGLGASAVVEVGTDRQAHVAVHQAILDRLRDGLAPDMRRPAPGEGGTTP
jgi:2-succinyl-5-enolpyruvyl-6-hydroxy-3-cyclohexene-1-carboxylate synthase